MRLQISLMAPLMTGYAIALLFFLGLPWSHRINPAFTTDRAGTRRTSIVLGIVHLIALVLPLAASIAGIGPYTGSAVAWAAVGLMVAALLLQRWTQRLLGSRFTLALQSSTDQSICRDGPYRWIRHPAYLAQILLWIALGLTSQSVIAAAAVAVMAVAGYAYRIREEERMLTTSLGARYGAYAASTKRLIPLLW